MKPQDTVHSEEGTELSPFFFMGKSQPISLTLLFLPWKTLLLKNTSNQYIPKGQTSSLNSRRNQAIQPQQLLECKDDQKGQQCDQVWRWNFPLTCRVARLSFGGGLKTTRWWVTRGLEVMILSDNTAVHLIQCQRGNFSPRWTDDRWIGRSNVWALLDSDTFIKIPLMFSHCSTTGDFSSARIPANPYRRGIVMKFGPGFYE